MAPKVKSSEDSCFLLVFRTSILFTTYSTTKIIYQNSDLKKLLSKT
ncbi:hypothetical protein LEP1GSC037_3385 [Leptospira interrogans str. 2006001854]|uniref:Uncharacterized protein n=1 Tax=Leptospira interrogans str. 2006001854 TaxID=1001590 RepID=M6GCL4_LEPIR|nr:hypothetical protein LEP1GSC037_3385 [Leptospira interrogans str. 2006001854]